MPKKTVRQPLLFYNINDAAAKQCVGCILINKDGKTYRKSIFEKFEY